MTDEATHDALRGNALAQISTGLVQLHSSHYGKGPTKAKTYALDELVVCVLRDGFTTVERTCSRRVMVSPSTRCDEASSW